MDGCLLRFYFHENQRHQQRLAWEWLLDQAIHLGIRGGTACKAMAGFGHHHHLQEARFFELAGDLAVEVEFIVTQEEAQSLLDLVHRAGLRVFYAQLPARFGVVNPDREESAGPARCSD